MIFYFTGTGNSRWVAEALGTAFDEPLVSIADALNEGKDENVYPLREREKVFFVFPVHSWGPAVLVSRFISRLILSGYKGQEGCFPGAFWGLRACGCHGIFRRGRRYLSCEAF